MRGVAVFHAREPDLVEVLACGLDGFVLGHAQDVHGRFDDVLQHRHVRPQIEMLKHHGQFGAQALQLFGVGRFQLTVLALHQQQLFTGHFDTALVRLFQQVDATQKGTFARAGTADDADHIPGMRRERHTLEHLIGPKAFMDVFDLEFECGGGHRAGNSVSGKHQGVCNRISVAQKGTGSKGRGTGNLADLATGGDVAVPDAGVKNTVHTGRDRG